MCPSTCTSKKNSLMEGDFTCFSCVLYFLDPKKIRDLKDLKCLPYVFIDVNDLNVQCKWELCA